MASTVNRQSGKPLQRWRNPDSPWLTFWAALLLLSMLGAVVLVPIHLIGWLTLPGWAWLLLGPGVLLDLFMLGFWLFGLGRAHHITAATQLPDGMREFTGDDASFDWGDHGPPVRLHKGIKHRIEGTSPQGRPFMLVATYDTSMTYWAVLLEVEGWLPNLTVWNGDALSPDMLHDDARLEDYEFNRRYQIFGFDRSTLSQRYAHAFFTPRMMEYLLSTEPEPFWVRGTWLVAELNGATTADEALKHHRRELDRLDNIADRIPRHLYGMFAGDIDLRARCRAANERDPRVNKPV